jgi:hypothetical protein
MARRSTTREEWGLHFDEIGDETDCKFRYELVEDGKLKFVRIV